MRRLGPAASSGDERDGRCEPGDLRIRIGTSAAQAERLLILATLSACGGKKNETARMLSMSVKTLYNRLHMYDDPDALPITNGHEKEFG